MLLLFVVNNYLWTWVKKIFFYFFGVKGYLPVVEVPIGLLQGGVVRFKMGMHPIQGFGVLKSSWGLYERVAGFLLFLASVFVKAWPFETDHGGTVGLL